MSIQHMLFPSLLLACLCQGLPAQDAAAEALRQARLARLAEKLEAWEKELADEHVKLASWCYARSLADEGLASLGSALAIVPEHAGAKELLAKGPTEGEPSSRNQRIHASRLERLQGDAVKGLDKIARWLEGQELDAELTALRLRILELDPDHAPTRKALGMVRHGEGWVAAEDLPLLQRGLVRHGEHVWCTPALKESLASGSFPFEGKTLTREEIDRARSAWEHAWEWESRHFVLRTSLPHAEALEILAALERARTSILEALALPALRPGTRLTFHWYRTREQFEANVPEESRAGIQYYGKDAVHKYTHPQLVPRDEAPRLLFEAWIEYNPSLQGLQVVLERGPMWVLVGAGDLAGYVVRGADGAFVVEWNRLLARHRGWAQKALESHGNALLPKLAGLSAEQWWKEFDPWYATTTILCGLLYEDASGTREKFLELVGRTVAGKGEAGAPAEILNRPLESFHEAWLKRLR